MLVLPRTRVARRGAAAVEFAAIAPLLILVILSTIEFSRAFMVMGQLDNAARVGGRVASYERASTSEVNAAVNGMLAQANIKGATTTVLVKGLPVDSATALSGDDITVQIAVPVKNVSWLPSGIFLKATDSLSGSVVMRRE